MIIGLLREAWLSIGAHPLRTFLAMLGIVIGVASVVLMLAIGAGSQRAVEESIEKLGTNLLIVTPGNFSNKGVVTINANSLTPQYVDAIAQLPSVVAAAATTSGSSLQITTGKTNWNTRVTGTNPSYFSIRNWDFAEGESFTADDVAGSRRVAVIGSTVADKLFPEGDAFGQTVRLNNTSFLIVGILAPKGQDFSGRDQDDSVFVPFTTAEKKLFGKDNVIGSMVQSIYVQAASKEDIEPATEEITDYIRQRHRLRETDENDFTVRNMASITQVASDTSQALSMLLGAIASISLIVGGIGIMNIMLVNVTERTREIGIRKAIGASQRQILLQFLFESMLIAAGGSLFGLLAGIGGGMGVKHWLAIPVESTLWPVLLSMAVAIVVGVASGIYPAHKAANLEPIEALRAVGG